MTEPLFQIGCDTGSGSERGIYLKAKRKNLRHREWNHGRKSKEPVIYLTGLRFKVHAATVAVVFFLIFIVATTIIYYYYYYYYYYSSYYSIRVLPRNF